MSNIVVARLVAPLVVETKEWSKGLGNAAADAAKWATNVAGTVAKAGLAVIASAAVAATAAIGGIGIALGKLAIDAAPLEGIGIAFDVMAESAGLSLDTLRQASAGTVSDFELMRKANVALTGAGEDLAQQMGQKLPALMEIARASARATGQSADFLFESLVTGVKRSSPMLIDNTGLQLSLGAASQALADSLGKTVEELSAEEKQIALLNATVEAGARMVEQFGGGTLTAAEQMAAFKTKIANAKDTIGISLLPILSSVMGVLGELASAVLPKVVGWMETFSGVIQDLFKWISGGVKDGDWLNEWLDDLPAPLQAVAKWFAGIVPTIKDFWEQLGKAKEVLQDSGPFEAVMEILSNFLPESTITRLRDFYDAAVDTFAEIKKNAGDAFDEWVPKIKELADKLPTLSEVMTFVKDHAEEFKGALIGIGVVLGSAAVLGTVMTIAATLAGLVSPLGLLVIAAGLLGAAWAGDWGGIRSAIEEAAPQVEKFIEDLVVKITEFVDMVKREFPQVKEDVLAALQPFIDKFKELADEIPGIVASITEKFNEIKTWFETNWPLIQAIAETAWTVIGDIVESVVGVIVEEVWPPLQDAFASLGETLETLEIDWDKRWENVKTTIGIVAAVIGAILVFLVGVIIGVVTGIARLLAFLAGQFQKVVSSIEEMIDGFIVFFENFVAGIKALIEGDFDGALEFFKAAFDGAMEFVGGLLDLFVTTIETFFGTGIELVTGFASGFLGFFIDLFEQLGIDIPDWLTDLQEFFSDGFDGILDGIKDWFNEVKTVFESEIETFKSLGSDLLEGLKQGITEKFNEIKIWFETNWPLIQAIAETAWTVIGDIVESVVGVIVEEVWPPLQEAFESLGKTLETMEAVWDEVWGSVSEILEPIVDSMLENLTELLDFIGDLEIDWAKRWENVKTTIGIVAAVIGAILVFLVGVIIGVVTGIARLLAFLAGQFQKVVSSIEEMIDGFIVFFENFVAGIKALIEGDFDGALEFFKTAFDGAMEFVGGLLDLFVTTIETFFGTGIELVMGFASGFLDFFIGLFEQLGIDIPDWLTDLQEFFSDGFDGILDGIKDWFNEVKTVFESKIETFKSLGSDLLEGLKQGIIDKIGAVVAAVVGAVSDVISAARDTLGIDSPSKVFWGMGQNIDDAMAGGIGSRAHVPAAAAGTMADGAISTVNTTINQNISNRGMPTGGLTNIQEALALIGA